MLMGAAVSVFHADRVSRRQHSGRHTDAQTSPCEVESSSKARGPGRVSCCMFVLWRCTNEGTRLSVLQGATLLRDCTVLIRGQRSLCIIRCLCWTAEYSAFLGRVSSNYANIYGSRGASRLARSRQEPSLIQGCTPRSPVHTRLAQQFALSELEYLIRR